MAIALVGNSFSFFKISTSVKKKRHVNPSDVVRFFLVLVMKQQSQLLRCN